MQTARELQVQGLVALLCLFPLSCILLTPHCRELEACMHGRAHKNVKVRTCQVPLVDNKKANILDSNAFGAQGLDQLCDVVLRSCHRQTIARHNDHSLSLYQQVPPCVKVQQLAVITSLPPFANATGKPCGSCVCRRCSADLIQRDQPDNVQPTLAMRTPAGARH